MRMTFGIQVGLVGTCGPWSTSAGGVNLSEIARASSRIDAASREVGPLDPPEDLLQR